MTAILPSVAAIAVALSASDAPATLRILAAGATESTLRAMVPEFESRRGVRLQLAYGGVGQLRDRLVAGERADVVIATPVILEQLEAKGLVRAASRVDLGRVGGGIAVRAGEPRPAVGTPDELKRALLDAEEIYFPDPASTTAGAYLVSVAERLGVAAELRRKARTAPGGKQAMERLAASRGRALGITQISEILSVKEVALVGPYPAPLQTTTTYSGTIVAAAADPALAEELLRFLVTAPVQARFRSAGFDAMSGSR